MITRLFFLWFFACGPILSHAAWFGEEQPEINIDLEDQALSDNILAFLSLTKESCESEKWRIEKMAEQVPDQARQALKALGFYHAEIETRLSWTETCWNLDISVLPGKPVWVASVDVSIIGAGKEDKPFVKLLDNLSIKPGDVLNHGQYEALKKSLIDIAENRGYFSYRFDRHQLRVNTEDNRAEIIIKFDTGNRYYFGEISIDQDFLEPEFVRKFLKMRTGKPYRRSKINDTFFVLDGSGYFKQVFIDFQQERAANYLVPVAISLTPQRKHGVSLGVGFDTDLGFRGSIEYVNRYVNRKGHRFETNLSASQRKSFAFLTYRIPLADPVKQKLAITGSFVYEDTENILSETYSLGVRYTQVFQKEQVLISQLNFVAERFDSGGGDEKFKILLVPTVSWANVVAHKTGFYRSGFKYFWEVQGAHEYLFSDVNFIQTSFQFKIMHNLPWDGKIIARTDLGATAVNDFEDLPTSYRFYTGGDNTVRGYKFKEIGAVNDEGEVIGGKFLTVASLEYEQLVYKDWSLAVFVDAGDAFNDEWNLKLGVGWGIRWYSLIGPIRLDMAFPSEDWDDFRIHFSFSTSI